MESAPALPQYTSDFPPEPGLQGVFYRVFLIEGV